MNILSKRFIYTSLAYMIGGLVLLAAGTELYTSFYFTQLYGFVGMMIFGISYHVIPRVSGKNQVYSYSLGRVHFFGSNIGILGIAGTFVFAVLVPLRQAFFIVVLVSLLAYAYNMHKTMQKSKDGPLKVIT